MTLSLYISIIICWTTWKMQCSSLDLSVKLETFNFEQRCQYIVEASIYVTQRNPWILANKINHEQKHDVPAGL